VSSELKEDAGNPSRLNRVIGELAGQAYRTKIGFATLALLATTVLPSTFAEATKNL
jgi:hypothetical protein